MLLWPHERNWGRWDRSRAMSGNTFEETEKGQGETMQSTNWAEEHSRALREFLDSGMSYSRIADAINAKFKTTYSRNAAIGRPRHDQRTRGDQAYGDRHQAGLQNDPPPRVPSPC